MTENQISYYMNNKFSKCYAKKTFKDKGFSFKEKQSALIDIKLNDNELIVDIKRQNYESLFWAISIFALGLYLLSFKPLLFLLMVISLSFAYFKKRFIPLYMLMLLLPFVLNILILMALLPF